MGNNTGRHHHGHRSDQPKQATPTPAAGQQQDRGHAGKKKGRWCIFLNINEICLQKYILPEVWLALKKDFDDFVGGSIVSIT